MPFTLHLLGALEAAGHEDRAALARLYPRVVTAWRWWADAPPGEWTAGELLAALGDGVPVRSHAFL